MKYKVMIAEDERMVREELAYFLQQQEDIILCPSAENGRQLLELYQQYQPEVIFLDIDMPALSGMEVARFIKNRSHDIQDEMQLPLFVFTTAYDEYAVQAFNLEAVDYLLKPYDMDRLNEALQRVRKHLQQFHNKKEVLQQSKSANLSSRILIDNGEKMVIISPDNIHYAAKEDRTIKIVTTQQIIHTKMTLQELENKVQGAPFFRPHRSYLVNLDYVREITPWFNGAYNLILKDQEKTQIPVSRSAAKELFSILQN